MIRLITFDLDNTLWNVDAVIRRAETGMREWLRQRAPEYDNVSAATLGAIRDGVVEQNPGIVHDVSLLRETVLRATMAHCGYPPARAAELAAGAFAEFLNWRHRVDFFPNALNVLDELTGDYTLAALTNGNADFKRLGLNKFFSFGYCAADVGASKPHTAMFERAIHRAGVTPAEAVHVGDHAIDDVQGATAAGMASIWVNLTASGAASSAASDAATATVTSLDELPDAIAELSGTRRKPFP